jgi:hypothetical protein
MKKLEVAPAAAAAAAADVAGAVEVSMSKVT